MVCPDKMQQIHNLILIFIVTFTIEGYRYFMKSIIVHHDIIFTYNCLPYLIYPALSHQLMPEYIFSEWHDYPGNQSHHTVRVMY